MASHRVKRTKLDDIGVDPQTVIVEEDGDLHLDVGREGGEPTTYVVCSRALARHSPVFKAMLFGDFAEARPTEGSQWIVEVSEDNREMFPIFLNIVHGCFKDVPTKLHIQELCALVVIVEKYDALPIIRPWVKEWMDQAAEWSDIGYSSHLVCLAWVTGHRAIFENNVRNVIYTCYGSEQELFHDFQFFDHEALHPPGLFEYLAKLREDVLQAIMRPFLDLYYQLTVDERSTEAPVARTCVHPDEAEQFDCESLLLGSLMISFTRRGLDITQKEFKYNEDLKGLKKEIDNMRIQTDCSHDECASLVLQYIDKGRLEEERLITEAVFVRLEHLEHLQKQAKKTGLDEHNQAGSVKHRYLTPEA
ncbi:hypothetical protein CGCS363_v002497 [Colletotrichum siamense]|uniref:uncharacterized protein n=1 Tax=Colletotrichum siamense TaxID=690259 RepID=UPI001872F380|nr:uncharacterized protein CGCS363_v002497 [Colletotrichum siamense]KAF5510770.1 hypothetical protein CGCS363_v002497 [Colletotrichum siamense]